VKEEELKEDKKSCSWGNGNCCHRGHRSGSISGMIFIIWGILLLLNTLNIVPWTVWDYIWPFWPFILIFCGLRIIFGFARWFVNLIRLIVIILVGLFAIYQVMPTLLSNLPPVFYRIFDIMKGIQK
jgi:hypothetical protein